MKDRSPGREQDICHLPVMEEEVGKLLVRESTRLILDCTVGSGGHAAVMLEASPEQCVLYGIDLDDQALRLARRRLSRFGRKVILKRMNFKDLERALPQPLVGKVDALLIDCGISRLQIVTSSRGFSFDRDGALDMRFDLTATTTAASLLSSMGVAELKTLLVRFGERAKAGKIAAAVVKRREAGKLRTTLDLAEAVKSVVRSRAAKSLARTFLAIRTRVNCELENLAAALDALPHVLARGGRACVISYHSEEDRIVKRSFRRFSGRCVCPPGRIVCDCGKAAVFNVLTPKPLLPTADEIRRNPSARSAKARVVEKM
jgi:16S rRNA (cytosine1402-N4)-methyltransferase